MGIGGNFWDLLKPYARAEPSDFLLNKKVAIDLSFWIVQHETALKNKARNPHIRVTFFRTVNLLSKLGAFPVFVVDGAASPLKARARMERFCRFSGVDLGDLEKREGGASVERNGGFQKCVRECVELLELLGMPVLKAKGEAEALCAQLNSGGHVDACITSDSDAFLYGAKCVIKSLHLNSKEPFECYHMSDIEAALGLKRTHMVAISLLVGNDHDLSGVPGVGIETALRFVRLFPEDDILNRLREVGNGEIPSSQIDNSSVEDHDLPVSSESSPKTKLPHCSNCGHPGTKRAHSMLACAHCIDKVNESCTEKPPGFKCQCSACNLDRKSKEQKKHESWQLGVCRKIFSVQNFPNDEIIKMYLSQHHGTFSENQIPSLLWGKPEIDMLIDFLGYHQHWEPSYIRQRMLPLLSTNFLRERASNTTGSSLLHGQYEFHSIQRVKIRYGQPCYMVTWRKAVPSLGNATNDNTTHLCNDENEEILAVSESVDLLDEPDVPNILVDDEGSFLLTEEIMALVQAAFPEKVQIFQQEKNEQSKSSKAITRKISEDEHDKLETPKSSGAQLSSKGSIQLSIKEFYRSTKVAKQEESASKEKKRTPTSNLSKSVRRRLLFD